MQLAYLDESHTADDYYITALCVSDGDALAFQQGLDGVVEWAQDNFGRVHETAELHAVDIVGGHNDWHWYRDSSRIPARIAVMEEAIRVIASQPVRVYIRGANIAHHRRQYGPNTEIHGTVLPWLLERVQGDAKRQQDHTLVIADDRARKDVYRADMADYRTYGTWGWRAQKLDRIVDTLHFAPSKFSRLLQAADLVSYTHTMQHKKHRDPRATAAWDRMWTTLNPVVMEASCWRS